MKHFLSLVALCIATYSIAQNPVDQINKSVTLHETRAHLEFLAADEMRGRDTGSPESEIAANYIATYFKMHGVKPVKGDTYFQKVPFVKSVPPTAIDLKIGNESFKLAQDLLLYSGTNATYSGDVVFVGYGSRQELEKANIKGKLVLALVGTEGEKNLMKAFMSDSKEKNKSAMELGATGLIEIVTVPGIPFEALVNYLNSERLEVKSESASLPHLWMRNVSEMPFMADLRTKPSTASLNISGAKSKEVSGKNVAGLVEGTDAKLKNEYIVISAHYDHVGVGKKNAENDSIFNGTRDNAIGTVGLMTAAKYFAQNPPKRSVLFLAVTGEEKGLLGSAYYANNPLVPLKQTVFNFNTDGAGYNDKTKATIIGMEFTDTQSQLEKACSAFGLKATLDPVPEQNLYERSDNFSFAAKGVPAIDFSPGVNSFDQELMKYYHTQEDETNSIDFDYLLKFYRSFVYSSSLFSNQANAPAWKQGAKYEALGKKLYGK